jgi:hypothetical protein
MPSVPREPDERDEPPEGLVEGLRLLLRYGREAEERERAAAPGGDAPVRPAPAAELTPAQKARARAKHARRIAAEQWEAES